MGVNIGEIVSRKEITFSDLKGKTVAIDAFNALYQFLTTIRQQDGTPLTDSKGKITSHLSGLFYRNINLLGSGINLVYIFDGKPPELKKGEIERRKTLKKIAMEKYEEAKESGDEADMKKYASRTVKITEEIIEESKELLLALGIPIIQAESEGEAEAAGIAKNKLSWAAASQDYDSLLYGAPKLVRNLTLSRKRKNSVGIYADTEIELVELSKVLEELDIGQDQLICLAILVGTDYNPKGVRGIGQKRALEIVQKYKEPSEIFDSIKTSDKYTLDFEWEEIFNQFKKFEIITQKIPEARLDKNKIFEILVDRHEFSRERIENTLEKLKNLEEMRKQKGLSDFW